MARQLALAREFQHAPTWQVQELACSVSIYEGLTDKFFVAHFRGLSSPEMSAWCQYSNLARSNLTGLPGM
jgi:hypothetical protein